MYNMSDALDDQNSITLYPKYQQYFSNVIPSIDFENNREADQHDVWYAIYKYIT